MHKRTKYKLWTFQSVLAINELTSKGILEADLSTYDQTNFFTSSYQWMSQQMMARKIKCQPNHLPIWAWHSCYEYGKAPTLVNARALLSDIQIENGVRTIEFECPTNLALLSSYGSWNCVLDQFVSPQGPIYLNRETQKRLFSTGRKKLRKYDSIQAALPFLKLDWVKEIRDLNLGSNDFFYDPKEFV